ncbi:MAG: dihydropteroate synthase [Pseudomonadales bacterium]
MAVVRCRARRLALDRAQIMGVINVTPDSFSDGGNLLTPRGEPDLDRIERVARSMLAAGATLLDIGGESTRPGAPDVPEAAELARVIPVMERLRGLDTLLSVDTRKPVVARAALEAGAHLVNDVSGGEAEGMLDVVAGMRAGICLMHMQGTPGSMQDAPAYGDVVGEVADYLAARARAAQLAGISGESIVVDPGIGFGKTFAHNLALLAGLPVLVGIGYPVLIGVSRKSLLGRITGREVAERMVGGAVMAALAVERGARVIRTHDVAPTRDALAVVQALSGVT